ncbi:hypothetical protein OPV22_022326 [Ensete ventricosum]|uniref:60S acidic ribosomal protein P2 n=1 Tax=Ensete ventricosum TaxID=4639 RepID=A0AAV8QU27_ENSVE|nr:hypothetical protein OPV22_022326 [Ensete ventricosum]
MPDTLTILYGLPQRALRLGSTFDRAVPGSVSVSNNLAKKNPSRSNLSSSLRRISQPPEMKVIAAYLLAVLGGNISPTSGDVKGILESVGADVVDEKIELLLSQVGVATPAGVSGGGAAAASAAAEPKKEEKVEEKEESDEDMGFSLFD